MRVIAGTRKSLTLKTLKGMNTRPTMDRTKETLFNILNPYLIDCTFLDLFSGSGGIGIEALSRGAEKAVLVEKNKLAADCIKSNLITTRFTKEARLMIADVFQAIKVLERENNAFDVIFMDPPFDKMIEKEVLKQLKNSSLLHKDTLIIVEAAIKTDFTYLDDLGFLLQHEKKYKNNKHVFIDIVTNQKGVSE